MALITCPECGKDVSDSAVACPNCGFGIAALKERNFVQIKISLCDNITFSDVPIVIFKVYNHRACASVFRGGIAKFEIEEDIFS